MKESPLGWMMCRRMAEIPILRFHYLKLRCVWRVAYWGPTGVSSNPQQKELCPVVITPLSFGAAASYAVSHTFR